MFDSAKMRDCLRQLVGWRNHYNATDIPPFTSDDLTVSESGQYMQDVNSALRLDFIKATLPKDRDLEAYLLEKQDAAIDMMLNRVVFAKKHNEAARETLVQRVLLDGYGDLTDTIQNDGYFVGYKIKPNMEIGLRAIINSLAFQFTQAQTTDVTIYVYHSSQNDPIKTFPFNSTTDNANLFKWIAETIELDSRNETYSGGVYFVGYYQDDIMGQAVNHKQYDWFEGTCSTCDGGVRQDRWLRMRKFMQLTPVYVPAASIPPSRTMFRVDDAFEVSNKSWGMNFNITTACDLTTFYCEQKATFLQPLLLQYAILIMDSMVYSQQLNYIEEGLRGLIKLDLEGDKESHNPGLRKKLDKAIDNLNFDHSMISDTCLACDEKPTTIYDAM